MIQSALENWSLHSVKELIGPLGLTSRLHASWWWIQWFIRNTLHFHVCLSLKSGANFGPLIACFVLTVTLSATCPTVRALACHAAKGANVSLSVQSLKIFCVSSSFSRGEFSLGNQVRHGQIFPAIPLSAAARVGTTFDAKKSTWCEFALGNVQKTAE